MSTLRPVLSETYSLPFLATKSIGLDKGVDVSFPNLDHQLNYLNSDSVYNPNIQHAFEYNLMFDNIIIIYNIARTSLII